MCHPDSHEQSGSWSPFWAGKGQQGLSLPVSSSAILTGTWQDFPHPLLQHFWPGGQDPSPVHLSAQVPNIPSGTLGHVPGLCSADHLPGILLITLHDYTAVTLRRLTEQVPTITFAGLILL